MNKIQLGLLELGYREQSDSLSSFQAILDYACKADEFNYSRFWLAEHHNTNAFAPYTNPEIVITLIAAMTENIRIGSAGILLGMYEPYHLAMTFKLLNNLYNNRLDLGLAKGLPSNHFVKSYLKNKNLADFHDKLADLYYYLNEEELCLKERQTIIPPFKGTTPDLWYLSNSYSNSKIIIQNKCNLCRSIMHGSQPKIHDYQKEELSKLKELYFEKHRFYPQISIAFAIVMASSLNKAHNKISLNIDITDSSFITAIPCTYKSLQDMIYKYQEDFDIDEFIIYDLEGDSTQKIKNIEKISEIMNL